MSTPLVSRQFESRKLTQSETSQPETAQHAVGYSTLTLRDVLDALAIGLSQVEKNREPDEPELKRPNVVILQSPILTEVTRTFDIDPQSGPTLTIADTRNLSREDITALNLSDAYVIEADSGPELAELVNEAIQSQKPTVVLTTAQFAEPAQSTKSTRSESPPKLPRRPARFEESVSPFVELQQIVPEEVSRRDRQAIWTKSFSREARKWIARYNTVGDRDLYLWQWCLHGIELTRLPSVDAKWEKFVDDTKLLSVILCVLFDDVADRGGENLHRPDKWLEALVEVVRKRSTRQPAPHGTNGAERRTNENDPTQAPTNLTISDRVSYESQNSNDDTRIKQHIQVTEELWKEYVERLQETPKFNDFESLWRFDIDQFLTAMEYSQLINVKPALANPTEHDVYTPHNMLMVSFGTVDLMCSCEIVVEEYGQIREMLWHAQAMGRIGNILATWQRELTEKDISNGLVRRAISDGVISHEDANELAPNELEQRIKKTNYEQELFARWKQHRVKCQTLANAVHSMDLSDVLNAHDRFLQMHISSHGLI